MVLIGLSGPLLAHPLLKSFVDRRAPPVIGEPNASEREQHDFGQAIFNTSWQPAGTAGAARIDGLGPMFSAASCDACHNNGARARGMPGDGSGPRAIPTGMVIQLAGRGGSGGDPVYGRVLATSAITGHRPEARVRLSYSVRKGSHADGQRWQLRVPHYAIDELPLGPLDAVTVIRPRMAPQIFGTGLLDAVPERVLVDTPLVDAAESGVVTGRFGWQASSPSLADQTARAFAEDMGLTLATHPNDDCSAADAACVEAPSGGTPEVADELLAAVIAFQRRLAVPASPPLEAGAEQRGLRLFEALACAGCHLPELPVAGVEGIAAIPAFTDLRRHRLGPGLADRDVAGRVDDSRWRTAPLWGLGYALHGPEPALLHDGRARTVEEAILWHDGEAAEARRRFQRLPAAQRRLLLDWVSAR